jgi:beta-galactosidase
MNSEVWINGHYLGRYPYGYSTFQYNITNYLNKDKNAENLIAVRVDNSLLPSTRWYNGSGIYRNVWLITTRYLHFHNYKGVFVSTIKADSEGACLKVDYDLGLHFFPETEYQAHAHRLFDPKRTRKKIVIRSTLFDSNKNKVAVSQKNIEVSDLTPSYRLTDSIKIQHPALWSAETPNLYTLKSEIISEGEVIDDQLTTTGIRQLEFNPQKGMLVNGEQVKLKGLCLHHDAGSFGAAVPIEVWHRRLTKLKSMGCNAIRTSHNPAAPEFYDLCDQLGFYVLNEAFDEWTRDWFYNFTENPRGKATYGYHLHFNQWAETDLRAMVQRDRNHPSVVMYSVGNEIPDQKEFSPAVGKTIQRLIQYCHEEDSTRPVTAGCNLENTPQGNGFVESMDVAGYNYIERVNPELMYAPEYLKYPNKLCIGTETNFNLKHFTAYRDNDYVIGEFLWTGIDFLGESKTYPIRGASTGLLDIAGFEKPDFYLKKSQWSNEPTVRIAVSRDSISKGKWRPRVNVSKWNWIEKELLNVFVYTNCEEVELFINNKSLGRKKVNKDLYHQVWTFAFKPGKLTAIAYSKNMKVAEHLLTTTTKPHSISAVVEESYKLDDGSVLSFVKVSVVDNKGVVVHDTDENITVTINNGELIGLESSVFNYEGLFKTNVRKPYRGRLLAIIKTAPKQNICATFEAKGVLPYSLSAKKQSN